MNKPTINRELDSCSGAEVSDTDCEEAGSCTITSYSQVAATVRCRPLQNKKIQPIGNASRVDPKVKDFQEAVKSAERSSLLLNLNLGTTKVLNEDTIMSKASLAIMAAGAKVEGKKNNQHPSDDTITAIDDIISITQKASMYGRFTKPFKNFKKDDDSLNGTFYSMPLSTSLKIKTQESPLSQSFARGARLIALHPTEPSFASV